MSLNFNKTRKLFSKLGFVLIASNCSVAALGMTITGPITVSTVTVTGSVNLSSMTVSSLTVTDFLQVTGTTTGTTGSAIQMKFSSSTVQFSVTSTTYQAIPDLSNSITLSDPSNYIRISLNGMLASATISEANAYLTIMRDSTDLGDTVNNTGLASTQYVPSGGAYWELAGITIIDLPNDTNAHTYQAFIRTDNTIRPAIFTGTSVSYLLLEEIRL